MKTSSSSFITPLLVVLVLVLAIGNYVMYTHDIFKPLYTEWRVSRVERSPSSRMREMKREIGYLALEARVREDRTELRGIDTGYNDTLDDPFFEYENDINTEEGETSPLMQEAEGLELDVIMGISSSQAHMSAFTPWGDDVSDPYIEVLRGGSHLQCQNSSLLNRYYRPWALHDPSIQLCHCNNCCIHSGKVFVFDKDQLYESSVERVSTEILGQRYEISFVHETQDAARGSYENAIFVRTPSHFTVVPNLNLLGRIFFYSDMLYTWSMNNNWMEEPFHWILKVNSIVSADVEKEGGLVHPRGEAPVTIFDAPHLKRFHSDLRSRVCYKELLVGHVHSSHAIMNHAENSKKDVGSNPVPSFALIDSTAASRIKMFRLHLIARMDLIGVEMDRHKAVYISRSLMDNRNVTNEADIIEMLELHGFDVLVLTPPDDKKTIVDWDMMRILRSAALVIGAHGHVLLNALVCREEAVIIELHPFGYQKWTNAFIFKDVFQDNYLFWIAPNPADPSPFTSFDTAKARRNFLYNQDIVMDMKSFKDIMRLVEKKLDG